MNLFEIRGVAVVRDNTQTEEISAVRRATLEMSIANDVINYRSAGIAEQDTQDDPLPLFQLNNFDDLSVLRLNGANILDTVGSFETSIGEIDTPEGRHVFLLLFDEATETDHFFAIGGDPINLPTTVQGWAALENSVTRIEPVSSGPFAPNRDVPLDSFRNTSVSVLNDGETIDGTPEPDLLEGGDGNDEISGGGGADTLNGGSGDDTVRGNTDDDTLNGGSGNDSLVGQRGDDLLNGGPGNDILKGGGGDDTINGSGGNDFLKGGTSDDLVNGGAGNDRVFGNRDDDTVNGGAGNDLVNGGGGDDVLDGGRDNDRLVGGSGDDTFVFADGHGDDTIVDFAARNDDEVIDLSAISAINAITDLLNNHATQVGADVLIDTGGGNSIRLEGVSRGDLDAEDFLF